MGLTASTPGSCEELLEGKIARVYLLNQPVQGYKKIICQCDDNIWRYFIASLTVPANTPIVRAQLDSKTVEQKLTTDTYTVDKISSWFHDYSYTQCRALTNNKIYKENTVMTSDESQLDFFIDRSSAESIVN